MALSVKVPPGVTAAVNGKNEEETKQARQLALAEIGRFLDLLMGNVIEISSLERSIRQKPPQK
jgi:hypothetical protein